MELASHADRPIEAVQLLTLCEQADWACNRTTTELSVVLRETAIVLGAWDGEKLVGFARAIADGVFRAAIEDVIVAENYRGRGIGSLLVKRAIELLENVEEVRLGCAEELVSWYGAFGFEKVPQPTLHIFRTRRPS